jgi:hypothetical protein
VIIVALNAILDPIRGEKLGGDPGVLGQDTIAARQNVERAKTEVSQISDGRGDHIEAGLKGL